MLKYILQCIILEFPVILRKWQHDTFILLSVMSLTFEGGVFNYENRPKCTSIYLAIKIYYRISQNFPQCYLLTFLKALNQHLIHKPSPPERSETIHCGMLINMSYNWANLNLISCCSIAHIPDLWSLVKCSWYRFPRTDTIGIYLLYADDLYVII